MPKICFNFHCYRDIPLYADLCNLYLADNRFDFTIGHLINHDQKTKHAQFEQVHTYFLEVEGLEAELGDLADEIATKFLYSIWLKSAEVITIEHRLGTKNCLQHHVVNQRFCSECEPKLSDINAIYDISDNCQQCFGHKKLQDYELGFKQQDICDVVDKIVQGKEVCLGETANQIYLSLNSINLTNPIQDFENQARPLQQILFTHPQVITSSFIVNEQQALALSSFEKPFIKLAPNKNLDAISEHEKQHLIASYYDVTFADSRLLIKIAALLKHKGINWLFINKPNITKTSNTLRVTWLDSAWVQTTTLSDISIEAPLPRHDDNRYLQYDVSYKKNVLSCHIDKHAEITSTSHIASKPLAGIDAAICAMHSGLLSTGCITSAKGFFEATSTLKKLACIYFSSQQSSSVITQNEQGDINSFLQLPILPQNGVELIQELTSSDKNTIFKKYNDAFPDTVTLVSEFNLAPNERLDSLQAFMAYAALIVLPTEEISSSGHISPHLLSQELANKFHALAQTYQGNNAPRIDFPLCAINSDDDFSVHNRSINWRKTLASLMSFKLAGANPAILAFGFFDSFTDYLSNWIDHLEQQQGIDAVVLAGSDFSYEVLANRLCIRLGKNYPLVVNRQFDLDGANIAIGGMYLAKRRR
ncbi:hypothetical protein [Shewanella sp. KT0246]|uniref:Kae1-like domain-containing protein n=1 Tax=Shewanella sp. KT0246 TaxID=2815912 RepID=UPI001BC5325E|nr:hypothetical protein [Shewanella sp. KT0246]GIU53045.1 NiFe hydrogenase assembly chaperone HyaE [Shewanella sp. KT0246]